MRGRFCSHKEKSVDHEGQLQRHFVVRDFAAIDDSFLVLYPSALDVADRFRRFGDTLVDGVFKRLG